MIVRLPITADILNDRELLFLKSRRLSYRECYGKTPMRTFLDSIPLANASSCHAIDALGFYAWRRTNGLSTFFSVAKQYRFLIIQRLDSELKTHLITYFRSNVEF
jgi:hypothetical protein